MPPSATPHGHTTRRHQLVQPFDSTRPSGAMVSADARAAHVCRWSVADCDRAQATGRSLYLHGEVTTSMDDIRPGGAIEVLEYLHRKLDGHFRSLREARQEHDGDTPIFALEHDLGETDLDLLVTTVRAAVVQGFGARARMWWLPFVVYAAESGYDYVGDEYWQSFEQATPGWRSDHRQWIKTWFIRFRDEYGGAVPRGAFASNFLVIAWPITHAVLPTYLQRHLARLLFEVRTGLTTSLLNAPEALGVWLASRAGGYTERFRIFCENTTLLGQVAAALLSGEEEGESPYLVQSTLRRLVDGVSHEHQSRHWLTSACRSASQIRSRGFAASTKTTSARRQQDRCPTVTDPRLLLRCKDGGWTAYAEFPDLQPLSERLSHAYDDLCRLRARIAGADRPLATGRLSYPDQEVRLTSWPRPEVPFIQLERGDEAVNRLIADQCVVSPGPWWLFRCRDDGRAVEVKGKVLRPGRSYVLVGDSALAPPDLAGLSETVIRADGVRAYNLAVPQTIGVCDEAAIVGAGLSVLSEVTVRPVGLVARHWDGGGAVEWLAGEPAMVGIRAELAPDKCWITVDGDTSVLNWPEGEPELFLAMDGFTVGVHEVTATLLATGDRQLATGSLVITIRDPQVRPESATPGEGIRLLASPARPTLSGLWDGRATLSIEGPPGTEADLLVRLRGRADAVLTELRRSIQLPLSPERWGSFAADIRKEPRFQRNYDEAESGEVVVVRAGMGFASLTCDRGFRPLRWRLAKQRDGSYTAHLVDRTDGCDTRVELFPVEAPLDAVTHAVDEAVAVPPRGGLLRATAGDVQISMILPVNPTRLFALELTRSVVRVGRRSAREVARLACAHNEWSRAQLPGDAFARYQQWVARDAITRALVSLLAGSHWARLEGIIENVDDATEYLEDMQKCVGESDRHRALAAQIGRSLWNWLTPATLLVGFAETMTAALRNSGLANYPTAARFLLTLAGRPGDILQWDPAERDEMLEHVIGAPVLLRAARFAVLGTRALNDAEGAEGGF